MAKKSKKKKKSETNGEAELDVSTARKALAVEARKRAEACNAEIQEVLEKHHCRIQIGVAVYPEGNRPIFNIVPEEKTG